MGWYNHPCKSTGPELPSALFSQNPKLLFFTKFAFHPFVWARHGVLRAGEEPSGHPHPAHPLLHGGGGRSLPAHRHQVQPHLSCLSEEIPPSAVKRTILQVPLSGLSLDWSSVYLLQSIQSSGPIQSPGCICHLLICHGPRLHRTCAFNEVFFHSIKKLFEPSSSDEKCFSKALANSIGFGDMACYSNVTEDPQTTALCSGFKTQEGWGMIHGWWTWWLSFALRNHSPCMCPIVWTWYFLTGFADVMLVLIAADKDIIFSCGEQFGCMWMYSGEGWEYQVRWIIGSYPCTSFTVSGFSGTSRPCLYHHIHNLWSVDGIPCR